MGEHEHHTHGGIFGLLYLNRISLFMKLNYMETII